MTNKIYNLEKLTNDFLNQVLLRQKVSEADNGLTEMLVKPFKDSSDLIESLTYDLFEFKKNTEENQDIDPEELKSKAQNIISKIERMSEEDKQQFIIVVNEENAVPQIEDVYNKSGTGKRPSFLYGKGIAPLDSTSEIANFIEKATYLEVFISYFKPFFSENLLKKYSEELRSFKINQNKFKSNWETNQGKHASKVMKAACLVINSRDLRDKEKIKKHIETYNLRERLIPLKQVWQNLTRTLPDSYANLTVSQAFEKAKAYDKQ
jgi:hypothetical protein